MDTWKTFYTADLRDESVLHQIHVERFDLYVQSSSKNPDSRNPSDLMPTDLASYTK